MIRCFTSESVTCGHPDKVCDQIADRILDEILAQDPAAHVACEVSCTTDLVHGLNKAVAVKTAGLIQRAGGRPEYMITGGVAQNKGVIRGLRATIMDS